MLYGFNIIAVNYNFIIPINVFSVAIVALFDIPGVFMLFLIMKLLM